MQRQFSKFYIPDKFFDKLYEFTGSDESNKGFIIAYVPQDGDPVVYTKASSSVIEMGLRKALEQFLLNAESSFENVDIPEEGE